MTDRVESHALDLEHRAALTAGADMWHTVAAPGVDLRSLRVSDGPAGARGPRWFASSSACAPCGSALGATWSRSIVAEVAKVLAAEARRKGADVLLAPTVNLHRNPLAGRNFECYSEDPELTSALAVSFITALQAEGVAACVKHLVANDQETDRHEISAEVEPTALRELYLRPFEAAVRSAGTWSIMAAYNRLGGIHCSQNRWLLTEVLREEWGFDGLVMSDWFGTHDVSALAAGLDLEMPGPAVHLGSAVAEEIRTGRLDEGRLDDTIAHLLRLADRVGARGDAAPPALDSERPVARPVLREAAVQSLVLLRNEPGSAGAPLIPFPKVTSLAIVGPNAATTAIMGGGSASFVPDRCVDVLDSMRDRLGETVEIRHEVGVHHSGVLHPLNRRNCRSDTGPHAAEGFVVEHFATPVAQGEPVVRESSLTSRLFWMGPPAPGVPEQGSSLRLSTWFTPGTSGDHTFSLVTGASGVLLIDGVVLLDNTTDRQPGESFFGLGSAEIRTTVHLTSGTPVLIEATTTPMDGLSVGGVLIGHAAPVPDDPLARAVAAAASSDIAVVVLGGDDTWETEGADRGTFELPGSQSELARAVIAANANTVVLLNCGAATDLSFADGAPALLQMWYPGQEAGDAVADVLTGAADPGGRLPCTFAHRLDDYLSNQNFPGSDGTVNYREGMLMGYRGFDATGTEPAFCFGHGLSTTHFEWSGAGLDTPVLSLDAPHPVTVSLRVTNVGERSGTDVVQCYLAPLEGRVVDVDRPPQHLAGFAKVHLGVDESTVVRIPIEHSAIRRWNVQGHWEVPTGTWEVRLSASSRDHRACLTLQITP